MIQRIQSLWLFLASLPGFLFFFLPISKYVGNTVVFNLYANGIESSELFSEQLAGDYPSFFVWLLMIFIVAVIVLPFITIFRFKDRKKQVLFVRLSILLNIILLVLIFLLTDMLSEKTGAMYQFNYFTTCSPIVSIIFLFLGLKGIQKDEKLVKAADRIR